MSYLDTMLGALVQMVMNEVRKFDHAETAWQNLDEEERRQRLDAINEVADEMCQKFVDAIGTDGQKYYQGTFKKYTGAGNLEIVVVLNKSDDLWPLLQHQGGKLNIMIPQYVMDFEVEQEDDQLEQNQATADIFGVDSTIWTPGQETEGDQIETDGGIVFDDSDASPDPHADDNADDESPNDDPNNRKADPDDPDSENIG